MSIGILGAIYGVIKGITSGNVPAVVQLNNLLSGEIDGIGLAVINGASEYETVAASQTDQVLGTTGASGDYLERLVCVVATAATAQVQIKDGTGSAITVLPNSPGGGIGTYTIPLGLRSSSGAWKITTGAGVSVIAVGVFE